MDNIFLQMSSVLGITVAVAFVVRLLRQPLLIAYIVAGIISGPFFLNLLNGDVETFQSFAELGVVLLLFVVGLSLNFDYLKKMGRVSAITGVTQVFFTALVGFVIVHYGFHISLVPSLYLSIAITFSSTIIITKLLSDKRSFESMYGRHVIGLMLVQDVIAISIMIILSTVTQGENTLMNTIIVLFAKGIVLIAVVVFLSKFLLPRLLHYVANSSEHLFLFTIAWCFGIASLVHVIGFSIEIGAIIAGLSLGSSPYQPEIASRIRPLRDFFIVVFFLILGSQMQLSDLSASLGLGLVLSLFVLIGNPIILFSLFRLNRLGRRSSFLASVTAAQVSEFGFVLIFTGAQLGHLNGEALPVFTVTALITIFISSYVITYNEQLYHLLLPIFRLFGPDKHQKIEKDIAPYAVWVFGYHRMGWQVCETLTKKGVSFAVVDFDPEAINRAKNKGFPVYFGDASDIEFLSELPLHKAKMVISTVPQFDDQKALVSHIRKKSKTTKIIATLYDNTHIDSLYAAGADYIMLPHLLGGTWIANVLKKKPWTQATFKKYRKAQKEELRLRLKEHAH